MCAFSNDLNFPKWLSLSKKRYFQMPFVVITVQI